MSIEEKLETIKVINKRIEEIEKDLAEKSIDISLIEAEKIKLTAEREELFAKAENLMK